MMVKRKEMSGLQKDGWQCHVVEAHEKSGQKAGDKDACACCGEQLRVEDGGSAAGAGTAGGIRNTIWWSPLMGMRTLVAASMPLGEVG